METKYIKIDASNLDRTAIEQAARLLRQGEIVAFPTETVYGLGADALNVQAVQKIFLAKGRPTDNPLIVHIAGFRELKPLVEYIPPVAAVLMDKFWPGPLTMIFPKSKIVPDEITAGLATVAVRMPEHPVALALIQQAGVPVAAPSANVSGRPSPTSGQHVWQDLKGKVAMVLDAGETRVGVESTVVDLNQDPPMILRPGGLTREKLEQVIGPVAVDRGRGQNQTPRSPGMKYKHYAPKAEVYIVSEGDESRGKKFTEVFQKLTNKGQRVALLVSGETYRELGDLNPCYLEILGSRQDLSWVAHRLFSAFRQSDLHGAEVILIEEFPDQNLGVAVMNRIRKAAANKVID